jgi:hypothetical protein
LVDQSYLRSDFKARLQSVQNEIDHNVNIFNLNTEQERAFRIVANHAVTPQSEQLKMYLGGMGGTGKSQVIRALKTFFENRNESHRFIILGPTGTSAALLGGSTYHSFLGINMNNNNKNENAMLTQVRSRLEGVDYIFIDEVSMLACHEMYKISSQLAKCLNVLDLPFGGVNMIFAGDFAQLPPVGGASLYSGAVGTQIHSGVKPHLQEAAIGKALWHQITTVVILRENMRQKNQTAQDIAFRNALVNMRYGVCTSEDIQFLRSRIAGTRSDQPQVASKDFRNVAIICGVHSQKDIINQLGCERFATETNQKLTNFYSHDKWGKESDPAEKKKWGKSKVAPKTKHRSNEIDYDDQVEIWKVRHGATEHFAGKLSLCLGMPVMIRNNDATELCITKGQEGFVVGWQSTKGPHNKRILDTLFVKLDNPPQDIKIPGLPDNVVPIVKNTKTVTCMFPSDLKESIERQQVWVLPNFAMTAHASQGKTRPFNVVHLNSCYSHMAYYTALSRSATADGTIIIQGFDSKVITRGCSGYLRQEFREHEILDDIARLRYEGSLPDYINGCVRNTLIRQYQTWKGIHHVPSKTDKSLRWSSTDPLPLLPIVNDSSWQLIDKTKNKKTTNILKNQISSSFLPAHGSIAISKLKRKQSSEEINNVPIKKAKLLSCIVPDEVVPLGLRWDADDYSCAYDSLFVILYDIWIQNPDRWTLNFQSLDNEFLNTLTKGFWNVFHNKSSMENSRDIVRQKLHNAYPSLFPVGPVGTSVNRLAHELFKTSQLIAYSQKICIKCNNQQAEIEDRLGYVLDLGLSTGSSTSQWLRQLHHNTNERCSECWSQIIQPISYDTSPNLLIFNCANANMKISHKIIYDEEDHSIDLQLRGIIYHGGFHFTSRIISQTGKVWYHDGMETGQDCVAGEHLEQWLDNELKECKNRRSALAIYARL